MDKGGAKAERGYPGTTRGNIMYRVVHKKLATGLTTSH